MARRESRWHLESDALTVVFEPLWGEPIAATLHAVNEDDEALVAEIVVSGATFVRVVASESFGLMDEVLDLGDPHQLDPRRPVRLTLRLRRGTYVFVAGHSDGDMPVVVARALADPEHPSARVLAQTEVWLVCTAMQTVEVPGDPDAVAEVGMRTGWAPVGVAPSGSRV